MISGKRVLCIIPARGGSKGIPHKNIKLMNGRPLIGWIIDAAKNSRYIDFVYVSTDDKKIAQAAENLGVEAYPLRPPELAADDAIVTDAVLYSINYFGKKGNKYDIIILLQATSPLTSAEDIDKALELFIEKKAKTVVSLCEAKHHPYWMNTLPPDGNMKDFIRKEWAEKNRQDLPVFYQTTGSLFIADVEYFKKEKTFFGAQTYAYIMPQERSVDIDNELDWYVAEAMLNKQNAI